MGRVRQKTSCLSETCSSHPHKYSGLPRSHQYPIHPLQTCPTLGFQLGKSVLGGFHVFWKFHPKRNSSNYWAPLGLLSARWKPIHPLARARGVEKLSQLEVSPFLSNKNGWQVRSTSSFQPIHFHTVVPNSTPSSLAFSWAIVRKRLVMGWGKYFDSILTSVLPNVWIFGAISAKMRIYTENIKITRKYMFYKEISLWQMSKTLFLTNRKKCTLRLIYL